jgi:hypothetical protein
MVALPASLPNTARSVAAAREGRQQQFDSYGLSMSELGSECDRALWMAFRWASLHEQIDGRKARLFETGHIEEKRILNDLEQVPGVRVERLDPTTGKQWKVYALGGHLRGKLDALADGLPEAPKTVHVIECKSHNEKSFNEVKAKGVKKAKIAHWWQCQFYMHMQGLDRCVYYAVNKNDDDEHTERLEYDAVAVMQMLVRIETVISANRAPARIKDDPKSYPCIICRHKAVCHREVFGRNHCRTCVHSSPIIDPHDTAGQWLCERHNKTLTMTEQQAGCHAHLYLPDVVPGDQTDAGDDFIVYTMRDGSTWTDQEKKPPPIIRYFWHPESSSLWTTDDGSHPGEGGGDGALVEELSAEEYAAAQAYYEGLKNAPR